MNLIYFSILEPRLDTEIDEEDEKHIIEELETLIAKVNEVEKSLATKPLPCIALPTPLEDYSWLALGKTLTNLHDYITSNKMVPFSPFFNC